MLKYAKYGCKFYFSVFLLTRKFWSLITYITTIKTLVGQSERWKHRWLKIILLEFKKAELKFEYTLIQRGEIDSKFIWLVY